MHIILNKYVFSVSGNYFYYLYELVAPLKMTLKTVTILSNSFLAETWPRAQLMICVVRARRDFLLLSTEG